MSDRPHTPEPSDYARGYRMSIEELQSLREQLAAAEATITALREALQAVDEWRGLDGDGISNPVRAQVRAALRATESGEK